MKEKIFVSKELESVVDKENIFGLPEGGEIPITIWSPGSIIYTNLSSANISEHKVKIEFKAKPAQAQILLVERKILKICIGLVNSDMSIVYDSCDIKNLSVTSSGDLYLCRIVIDFSK